MNGSIVLKLARDTYKKPLSPDLAPVGRFASPNSAGKVRLSLAKQTGGLLQDRKTEKSMQTGVRNRAGVRGPDVVLIARQRPAIVVKVRPIACRTEFDRSMAPPIASNPEPLKLAFTLSATMVTFGVLAAAANPMALFLVATLSSIVTIALPLLPDAFATNPVALLVSVTFLIDVGIEPLRSSQTPTPEFKETIVLETLKSKLPELTLIRMPLPLSGVVAPNPFIVQLTIVSLPAEVR